MKINKNLLMTGTLTAALVLGACSQVSADTDLDWTDENNGGEAELHVEDGENPDFDAQAAVDKATERFDGVVKEVELDEDDDLYHFDIEMENDTEEYEVELNAEDLSVLEEDREARDDDDDARDNDETDKKDVISSGEAVEIAKKEVGGELKEWDFDDDDNEYEVEMNKDGVEYELEINGATGEILEVEQDD